MVQLEVLSNLRKGENTLNGLAHELNTSRANVCGDLKALRNKRLVKFRLKDGLKVWSLL